MALGIANKPPDKIPPGPKLGALTAEKVFGWKNVHKHEGSLIGKKQDKAGPLAISEGALLLDQPRARIFDRRPNETAWALVPSRPLGNRTVRDDRIEKVDVDSSRLAMIPDDSVPIGENGKIVAHQIEPKKR